MRIKTLVVNRSKSTGFLEEEMAEPQAPHPASVWSPSVMTKERIEALVQRGLLKPQEEVGWRPATGEAFPTEETGEITIFASYVERGFAVPVGDFLRGLLHYYRIDLVHLVPNSITVISSFIHLCEAYLGIPPHFDLWRYFFQVKKTGKSPVVGSLSLVLRPNMKPVFIDLELPENTQGWRSEWFYVANPRPGLATRTGCKPIPVAEWTMQLSSRDVEMIQPLLDDLQKLKDNGLTGGAVAISFSRRLLQPIKDRVHPAYEYWGQMDPTREAQRKVSKE